MRYVKPSSIRVFLAYTSVLLSCAFGVVGTSLFYQAISDGVLAPALVGLPMVLYGLFVAGGALARGMHATPSSRG